MLFVDPPAIVPPFPTLLEACTLYFEANTACHF